MVTHDLEEALLLADRVLVLTPRPARVAREIVVDLPRPRTDAVALSPAFSDLKRQVLGALSSKNSTFCPGTDLDVLEVSP
jgi:ABC-type nitrate/sulfonate/bicarbonate transport system ATPase subunit